jgi:hypothetical protein
LTKILLEKDLPISTVACPLYLGWLSFEAVKNAYAQEVEKNENLSKELSICHDSITNLRNENASLIAKIDKLNESISSLRM